MRIFYLEDEPHGRHMIRQLRRRGHAVDWATCVEDACEYLEYDPGVKDYDYLIFDLTLPRGEVLHADGTTEWYGYEGMAVGLEYIKKNSKLLRPKLEKERVAILTGFAVALRPELKQMVEDLEREMGGGIEIMYFDKASDDVTRAITQWLGI